MDYEIVFERIVESVKEMVGKVAVPQANRLEGIEVDEQGKVVRGEINSNDVVELVTIYEGVMGDGAIAVSKRTVKKLYNEDESVKNLDLPEEIMPKDVKAEKFAAAF